MSKEIENVSGQPEEETKIPDTAAQEIADDALDEVAGGKGSISDLVYRQPSSTSPSSKKKQTTGKIVKL